ncbi:MAG: ornithine cyclodeaminase family protein [Zavarzinella sp.]
MPVLHINEAEVAELLTMPEAVDAVETVFRKWALEEASNVPRMRCQTDHTMLHVLPAAAKTLKVIGYKAYTTTKKQARFHVTLYDGKTGDMLAIIQADQLGRIRTGAASGVATRYLARPDARTVGILGSGKQARTQLLAVAAVRPIEQAFVYSPTVENRQQFATTMTAECGFPVIAVDQPEQAVKQADVVCTITSSVKPVMLGEWLQPGQHLNIAGSNMKFKTEIDLEVIKRCSKVVVDSRDQAMMEAGDLIPAVNAGIIQWYDMPELGRLVDDHIPDRERTDEITLFKSLGIGLEDIAVGILVYEKARTAGKGRELDI